MDQKAETTFQEWKEEKKQEWLEQEVKKGKDVNYEDLQNQEKDGKLLEWEKELVGNDKEIKEAIEEITENRIAINHVSYNPEDYVVNLARDIETKLKEIPREKEREKRRKFKEKEKEKAFQLLLQEWQEGEKSRIRNHEREKDRETDFAKSKQKHMQLDEEYDSEVERKRRKKDSERYKRYMEDKRKAREKERNEDEAERRKLDEEAKREEQNLVEEENEHQRRRTLEEQASSKFETDTNKSENKPTSFQAFKVPSISRGSKMIEGFGISDDEDIEEHHESKPLSRLDDSLSKTIKDIEMEARSKFTKEETKEIHPQEMYDE